VLLETVHYRCHSGWSDPLPQGFDSDTTLVLAFGASEFLNDPSPFRALSAAYPKALLIGCSTAGEIAGAQVDDGGVSVAIARFEHTRLRMASARIASSADSSHAGHMLGESLRAREGGYGLRAVFVLSDGLNVNGTALVDALTEALPQGVAVSGGLAGDGARFESTWVLADGTPTEKCIVAVGFYGDRLKVGQGCEAGWSSFGPERRVTRAKGNVLYELDGKPALDLYKSYLGERAAGLPSTALLFPLSISLAADRNATDAGGLIRTVLAVDEASQSLTFAGEIPQGCVAQLMRANTDRLIECASVAVENAVENVAVGSAALVLSVSCVGRRLVLGERTDEELETVAEALSASARQVGFYSYGEISRLAARQHSDLHNQTMTVTVFSEA
jgi:hypothetical protein